MDLAKPWYQSLTVMSVLAALLFPLVVKLADFVGFPLPVDFDHNKLAQYLVYYVPLALAIIGRWRATHKITASKNAAVNYNFRL